MYTFSMPDGKVFHYCSDVDTYYDLKRGTTDRRLKYYHWSERECAYNSRAKGKSKYFSDLDKEYFLPNGEKVVSFAQIDRYFGLYKGWTYMRIRKGMSVEECITKAIEQNKDTQHLSGITGYFRKHILFFPNGERVCNIKQISEYYNISGSTVLNRLDNGWTIEECVRNKRGA